MASAVMMWANMLQQHILPFPPMKETADCVSSGCLREVKTIENFKQSSLKVVAYKRWSPTRGSIYSDLT